MITFLGVIAWVTMFAAVFLIGVYWHEHRGKGDSND
jgi:hypothetical protein